MQDTENAKRFDPSCFYLTMHTPSVLIDTPYIIFTHGRKQRDTVTGPRSKPSSKRTFRFALDYARQDSSSHRSYQSNLRRPDCTLSQPMPPPTCADDSFRPTAGDPVDRGSVTPPFPVTCELAPTLLRLSDGLVLQKLRYPMQSLNR